VHKTTAWLLLGGMVFLYLNLFVVPNTPIYVPGGDQVIYLENAAKMLQGQVLYKDFFQFTPPGTEVVYLVLFKMFGLRMWIPKAVLIVLGAGLFCASVSVSRPLLRGISAYLPGLLFLTLPYERTLDATHHWFSSLAAMGALAVAITRRTPRRMALAGALCGVALCFTQLRGLAASLGLSAFLLWEWRQKRECGRWLVENLLSQWGALVLVVVAFDAYFAWKVGLRQFLWSTVVFGSRYYPAWGGNNLRGYWMDAPPFRSLRQFPNTVIFLFINLLIPLVYLLFFVRSKRERRERPNEPWNCLMLVNLVGLFLFLGVSPSPTYPRLCSVSPPALILLVWFLTRPGFAEKVFLWGLCAFALVLSVVRVLSTQTRWRATLDLPTGQTAFQDPRAYEMHRWMLQHTRSPGFLFEEAFPLLNFSLNLQNPARVPFLTETDYTRPEQVSEVVRALETNKVHFIVRSVWLDYPLNESDRGDHLEPLRIYVRSHYHFVRQFGNEEVWERTP
jgi:hypothetical protein